VRGGPSSIDHVGIVVTPGVMVYAPYTSADVREDPFRPQCEQRSARCCSWELLDPEQDSDKPTGVRCSLGIANALPR
jgi:hypothetical protein